MSSCTNCGTQLLPGYSKCPQCGRPVPRDAQAKGGSRSSSLVLILLIVGVGFVAVAGIVAAILIPNFLDALQKAKQKRTVADLRNVNSALAGYASDELTYPQPGELATALAPKYISSFPATDGWGNPFQYVCWQESSSSQGCDAYVIASAGRDGVFSQGDLRAYEAESIPATDYDADLVVSDRGWVRSPAQAGSPQ